MPKKQAFKTEEGKRAVIAVYDQVLEGWPVPHTKFYVNTSSGETFIIACGDENAPPLILLHGSAFNSAMWLGDAREYAQNYRVYAVDIPGEAGRSAEQQLPFEGAAFTDWLSDVYDGLAIKKASIIGISLGAWLAIKLAAFYPEKVDRLVLLCPAGVGPQKSSFLWKALVHMLLGEKGMKKLYQLVNGNQPIPEEVLKYQLLIGKNYNYRRETVPLFSDDELKRLGMPVVLFVGEKDVMFHSVKTAQRLKSLLPHARINVLPDAGHSLINLTDNILEFLKHE